MEQHGQHWQNGRQQYSSGPPANRKHIASHNWIVPSERTFGIPWSSSSQVAVVVVFVVVKVVVDATVVFVVVVSQ
jgi:hypothetical protein